jgi:hypothetical protein
MGEVFPLPTVGDVFADARGDSRTMRVSYHESRGVVVVSLWADAACRGSFQLPAGEVARLGALLSQVQLSARSTADPGDHQTPADAEAGTVLAQPLTPAPERTGEVQRTAFPAIRATRVA